MSLSISREELRIAFDSPRYDLTAGYLWLAPIPTEGRDERTSELTFDTGWDGANWRGRSRLATISSRRAHASLLGLQYRMNA